MREGLAGKLFCIDEKSQALVLRCEIEGNVLRFFGS